MGNQDRARRAAQAGERRRVALAVFQDCDDLIARELGELARRGVTPSCAAGCAFCCRQAILATRAEAEAAAAWIQETFAPARLDALRDRLRAWLAWYRTEYPRLIAAGVARHDALSGHAPTCPALEEQACSIYPVRPIPCRILYVTSPPDACRPAGDPLAVPGREDPIPSVVRVTQGTTMRLRNTIEAQGADYFATVHLLPEWLAHLLGVEDQPWRDAPPPFTRP